MDDNNEMASLSAPPPPSLAWVSPSGSGSSQRAVTEDLHAPPNLKPAVVPSDTGTWRRRNVALKNKAAAVWALTSAGASAAQRRRASKKELKVETKKAVAQAKSGVAVRSRANLDIGLASLYFLLLERSWSFCAAVFVGVVCTSLGGSALVLYATGGYDDSAGAVTTPLRMAASHIVTMSLSPYELEGSSTYALAVLQCFLGVLLNVFLFAAVVTKFQRPAAHVLFANSVCFCTRYGQPYLLLRLGNLLCNTLHRPELTLTLMRRETTPEGEDFISRQSLEVSCPPTLSAVATFTHRIDDESPLQGLTEAAAKRIVEGELFIQATFSAYDMIYDADVCASRTYLPQEFAFRSVFKGVMSVDQAGHSVVDFESIHEVQPQRRVLASPMESTEAPRPSPPPELELVLGCGRASYGEVLDGGEPMTPLEQICGFCGKVLCLVNEAGIDFVPHFADISDPSAKPDWLKEINPKNETPVARLAGESEWVCGSESIIDALGQHSTSVANVLARRREPPVPDADRAQIGKLAFLCFTSLFSRASNDAAALGKMTPMAAGCLQMLGIDGNDVRGTVAVMLQDALATLERLCEQGDWLCGNLPGKLDFFTAIDVGILIRMDDLGVLELTGVTMQVGSATRAWHKRTTRRDAFIGAFGGRGSGAECAFMRAILCKLRKMIPDCLSEEEISQVLQRARDSHYFPRDEGNAGASLSSSSVQHLRHQSSASSTNAYKLCF